MPTPKHPTFFATSPPPESDSTAHWAQHTTCPPEGQRLQIWRARNSDAVNLSASAANSMPDRQLRPLADGETSLAAEVDGHPASLKQMVFEDDSSTGELLTPMSALSDVKDGDHRPLSCGPASPVAAQSPTSSVTYEFSNIRLQPTTSSSYLRAGSKFHGTQKSDLQVYDVQVELKHVDMDQSFLCGYLRIQGLAEDHPTLTTYFEGEVIGDKYSFQTKHPEWGSNDKVDMQHWARFHAWRPLAKSAKKPDFAHKNFAQRENIFMRWKEHFLVPDHRVRNISGASFDGFYYICFNQVSGNVSGIYFHAKSEKYQQLELTHVEDRGCLGAMEFR